MESRLRTPWRWDKNYSSSGLSREVCILVIVSWSFFGYYPKTVDRLNELINQYKLPILLSLVGTVLIIGGLFSSNLNSLTNLKPKPTPKTFSKQSLVDANKLAEIKVDISGAIEEPGVYSLTADSRVEDLIKRSGGFLRSANKEFIAKNLNLSQKITDGMKVYIPFEGEQATTVLAATSNQSSTNTSGLIGLNTALISQLDSLPGIGPITAQKIIDNRPYSDVSELLSKKVVGKSTFEKIKDLVDLN